MRRVLRSLIAAALALTVTGGSSIAFAGLGAEPAGRDCKDTTHPCTQPSISSCCCMDGGAPSSLPASSDRTSELKPQPSAAAFAVLPSVTFGAALMPASFVRCTHRAGPPQSLTVLHGSLLI